MRVEIRAIQDRRITKKYIKYPGILACIPGLFEAGGTGWIVSFNIFTRLQSK